ncbi:MAG: 30S ribosomal protein S6--L-glutamate ligase [Candidatus Omnitrophica bacterium]|nr:30S ribosomal protein S6--L-glutamate ligase [Candidatus Omnitrophota bacterium]
MKIAILSTNSSLYSTKRLKEAAQKREHSIRILNPNKFSLFLEESIPDVHYQQKPLEHFDAVIPRIGASITFFGTAVVRQFEQMGVYCLNTSLGILTARDKLRSIQLLARHHIGIPETTFVKERGDVLSAIKDIGGAPVIIKLLEGTQGIGVILAETNKIAEAIVETLHSTKQNVLIQKFVSESKGKDIRAFVIGGKVVAAMRRTAQGDEFRSNVHRGGKVEALELSEQYEKTAIQATQIMGLSVAGVDMLEGKNGPIVLEVNSSPGLEGIERATGIDIAGAIIDYIEEQSTFPEVDLRQRLTMSKGYGIAEIRILKNSQLKGLTIKESGFREKDIIVLSMKKKKSTISNPRSDRIIETDDVLLCFGKLETMQSIIKDNRLKARRKRRKSKNEEA